MNSIQKKSQDHKSCDLKNNNDIRPKTSNRSSRRRQTFGGDASSCLRDHQRNTNDPKRSLTKAIRSWNIWMCTMKKLQAIKYKSWTDMGHWMLEKQKLLARTNACQILLFLLTFLSCGKMKEVYFAIIPYQIFKIEKHIFSFLALVLLTFIYSLILERQSHLMSKYRMILLDSCL